MSSDARLERAATAGAEEVLQRIYGDDFAGCTVRLDSIASIIRAKIEECLQDDLQLLDLHEKATEGIHLLATPPEPGSTLTPEELQALLSDRLDTIRALTSKILETLAAVRGAQGEGET